MSGYPRPRSVPPTPLADLAVVLAGQGSPDVHGPSVAVTGVTHSGAQARPGDLFAALPGSRYHGARFAGQALSAGAVAVLTDPAGARDLRARAESGEVPADVPMLVTDDPRARLGELADRIYGAPTRTLPVVGITGTAGKTSTAYLVAAGIRAAGGVPGVIGTVETRLGDLVVDSARTTPEATDLHALLAAGLERGVTAVVMEVSSHALALGRVGGVRFAVGGFTNFGSDHLDFHRDLDDYFEAKARLFDGRCGVSIVNVDDPAGRRLVAPGTVTYTPPGGPHADWFVTEVVADGYGQRFVAHGPGGLAVPAGVALPGRHNIANALLALAALTAIGVDPAVAGRAVATCAGAPGRMERVDGPEGILGIVDYAHKPDAIREVLDTLHRLTRDSVDSPGAARRIICVLGAGGDRDRGKRPVMGALAAAGSDVVIVTDDNPRTEDPAAIRAEVLAGIADPPPGGLHEIGDRRAAIAAAVAMAVPGDVVAVLGKGHEQGQKIGDVVHPFDDRVELAAALAARGGHP